MLSEFAAYLDAESSSESVEVAAPQATDDGSVPLSFQQRQLLFLDDLSEGDATYNATLAFRVAGRLDVDALTRAVETLIRRHEVLRTVLRMDDDGDEQVVLSEWQFAIPIVDVAADQSDLDELVLEHSRRPFDLRRDLMLRAALLRVSPEEHVLVFQTHHVAFDAWAVEIFYRELAVAYRAELRGEPPAFAPLTRQYGDFARLQHQVLSGDRLEQESVFWRRYLGGAPTFLALPTDRPRPDVETFESGRYAIELPKERADELRAVCAAEGVTPYMFLMGAFSTFLYRETGADDILFGGPSANRGRVEFEGTIGFIANTVVTRVQLGGNPTFRELLGRVRGSVLEALDHEELPFERVVDIVRPTRRPGVNPLFQVNFRTRVGPIPTLELEGTTAEPFSAGAGLARFDLAFEAHVHEDGIDAEFLYATALFDRVRIERQASAFELVLAAALGDPSRRLLEFELPAGSAAPAGPRIQLGRGRRERAI